MKNSYMNNIYVMRYSWLTNFTEDQIYASDILCLHGSAYIK